MIHHRLEPRPLKYCLWKGQWPLESFWLVHHLARNVGSYLYSLLSNEVTEKKVKIESLLHSVEISEFFCHSDFMWSQVLENIKIPKTAIFHIFMAVNFNLLTNICTHQNQIWEQKKIAKKGILWTSRNPFHGKSVLHKLCNKTKINSLKYFPWNQFLVTLTQYSGFT